MTPTVQEFPKVAEKPVLVATVTKNESVGRLAWSHRDRVFLAASYRWILMIELRQSEYRVVEGLRAEKQEEDSF